MDELRLRLNHSKRLSDCNAMILTETWLNSGIPDTAIGLTGRSTHRADRTADDSVRPEAINEDHQGVAGGSRLRTPGQVSTHGLEYVYAPGQLWLTHTHTDIDNFTSTVLDHITTTIDSITTTKRITTYPNRKPWMNKEVWLLLKARNTAFRSGEAQAYSTARANLRRGIKKAKHTYKRKIEGHFSSSDPRRMWQGIQAITDYKPNNSSPTVMDTTFLNELNTFYARFEKDDKDTATRTPLPADHQPITLSSTAVYTALSRINPRKAAGPDGIPGPFNTVVPSKLITKLGDLGINPSLCNWTLDFLTNRPQHVSCTIAEHKALQRVVKTAQRITRTTLPAIGDVQRKRCLHRARSILKDSSHPAHRLFSLLPSGRRYRTLRTRTSRLRNSFFPRAVSLLNSC
ncbi:hypothetical protein D4764_06G0005310 [Takifugu flavidus]|uniref:Reverse transcriptase domain-containing protein n=1 Tax=Takifugu flavidus TaxID=433684 RepID=A0A5C6MY36_9TELE|nr:hypothetical protein D4764_06G0005310 [Takifugu flavidus]